MFIQYFEIGASLPARALIHHGVARGRYLNLGFPGFTHSAAHIPYNRTFFGALVTKLAGAGLDIISFGLVVLRAFGLCSHYSGRSKEGEDSSLDGNHFGRR